LRKKREFCPPIFGLRVLNISIFFLQKHFFVTFSLSGSTQGENFGHFKQTSKIRGFFLGGGRLEPKNIIMGMMTALVSVKTDHTTQRWWAEQVSESLSRRHDANGSVRDRTRLACQKGPIATGRLCALPNKALRTDIPDSKFRLLLLWWLGLPITCEAKGVGFSPFALATCGGLGSSAKSVLFEVTHRATADLHEWAKTHAMETIHQGLSVTLMRQIARQVSAKGRANDRRFTW